ncbi:teichoic acids export ABC transporter ATP-binding subunit TagH [Metabacillus rhizolycopersici]|uniref:Teichoic acids export ABC transporter ATP-binding subunit TagH n=1 Tax=Metabacillus rhizolycopersici TaxID=2875709 RepID=A0ABS7UM92_9BACI|nr:teichoic acids export ABC transporter ATP-binding subunit TagH [Metabacillus rhizolycopersici]MBZ5749073.1 teichoic acids export ABC transporter ATP-binding subunit TagH [Metabacillus rhizolycopersici]
MDYSIHVRNVTKKYKMHSKNSEKLKDILLPGGFGEDFYALRDVSFDAQKGDVIGIIGVNGSGKSTLSNLLSEIIPPTSGTIVANGEVSLIAIAAGLDKQLTGRENIELKCLLMGMKKEEIKRLQPEIIEFADIGKFIDMPVKKYSSGMKSRLGFAISVSADPDILVIDEALSVGDKTFADKCFAKMNEFKERGKTIFFVSHSAGQVKKFCTKALWLEHGTVKDYGDIKDIMPKYEAFIKQYKALSKEEQKAFKAEGIRKQSSKIKIGTRGVSKKKSNKVMKTSLIVTLSFLLFMSVAFFIFSKMEISDVFTRGKNESPIVNDKSLTELQNDEVETKPKVIRYVHVDKAIIRALPTTDSKQLETVEFGYSFVVNEHEVSEDDISWSMLRLEDGTNGWISDVITKQIDPLDQLEFDDVKDYLYDTIPASEEEAIALIGRTRQEVSTVYPDISYEVNSQKSNLVENENTTISFNENEIVEKITLNQVEIPIALVNEQLGEPHIANHFLASYIYQTDKYGLVFTSSDKEVFDKITIINAE